MMQAALRLLLALYPASHRRDFGAAWLDTADALLARAQGRARIGVFIRVVSDALRSLPAAHAAARADRHDGGGALWDLRDALRSLRRQPRFVAMTVLVLALGLAFNIAIFTVANSAFLRPLPYPQHDRLVVIWGDWRAADFVEAPLSPAQLGALRETRNVFEEVGGVWASSATLTGTDLPQQVGVGRITASLLRTLGVVPALGRLVTDDDASDPRDPSAQGAILVSHDYWERALGGDADALGTILRLDGSSYEVVGVLPDDFQIRFPAGKGVPVGFDVFVPYPELQYLNPANFYFRAIGRLQQGVTLQQANAALDEVAARLRAARPELADSGAVYDVRLLQSEWTRDLRPAVLGVQLGAALLLVLTLTTAASLFVSNAVARLPEHSVRAALGARRGRLARLLLFEAAGVAAAATVLGLALGAQILAVLWTQRPDSLARLDQLPIDARVVGFATAIGALALLAAVTGPVLVIVRSRLARAAMAGSSRATSAVGLRMRRGAAAFQIGATFALLVATLLMVRSVANLDAVDPGFQTESRLMFTMSLPPRWFPSGADRGRIVEEVRRAIAERPDVEAVGGSSHPPLRRWVNWASPVLPIENLDDPGQQGIVDHRAVTPGYFAAVGATMVEGRGIAVTDTGGSEPVAILDTVLARRLYGDKSALGRVVQVSQWDDGSFVRADARVVGVVRPLRDQALDVPGSGQVFLPFAQTPRWEVGYIVRARDHDRLGEALPAIVARVHGELAVAELRSMEDVRTNSTGAERFTLVLTQIVAAMAVVLSALGLYGVLSIEAVSRTREIGIRLAVGAREGQVFRLMLRAGARIALQGLAVGLPLSAGLAFAARTSLFGVETSDVSFYFPAALLVIAMAVLACALPSRRAARSDPTAALRGGG